MMSDIASTVPSKTSPVQSSATMFNVTVSILGVMALVSSYLIYRIYKNKAFTSLFAIFGAAGIAVRIFPGDKGSLHGIAALIWFISGPLSAIVAHKLKTKPLTYFSIVIGAFALMNLALSVTMHGSSPSHLVEEGLREWRHILY
jgi:hypothetical membrane protein